MKTLIIDDEENSHVILEYLISTQHPEIEIVDHAYNVEEGIAKILQHKPDLVFLDIELPPSTGFDLLKSFEQYHFMVIFITGHKENDYAITAFRFGGLDFLLKPIDVEDLAEAIRRCKDNNIRPPLKEQLSITEEANSTLSQKMAPTRITIPTMEEIYFRKVDDIIRLEAFKNYTTFHFTKQHSSIVASKNLGGYENQFSDNSQFMRVHKTHLVNLNFVDSYRKGEASLVTIDGTEIPVSKNKREELLERLKNM